MASVLSGLNGQGGSLESEDVNEARYSRQLYVLGQEAQTQIANRSVLVSGLKGGLGLEIAKNLALCGVGRLTLHDEGCVVDDDLASGGFFFREDHVRKEIHRASAAAQAGLAEMNPHVNIRLSTEPLTKYDIRQHDVIILVGASLQVQLDVSSWNRENSLTRDVIICDARGWAAFIFCDFGESFTVTDLNGEPNIQVGIASISHDEYGTVTSLDGGRHGLQDGDRVRFAGVEGMTELNEKIRTVQNSGPNTFGIGDTSTYGMYSGGGMAIEVKQSVLMQHSSLEACLNYPKMEVTDWSRPDKAKDLHLAFRTLYAFEADKGHAPMSEEEVEEFVRRCVELARSLEAFAYHQINQDVIRLFASTQSGMISPICAFLGGIVAQEAIKGISGKFPPISQWLYYDDLELASELAGLAQSTSPSKADLVINNSGRRYSGLSMAFSDGLKDFCKLANAKVFVVGAGAIGCELLKNLALLGVGTGDSGFIALTDPDSIELSNLSRQFLFRSADIGRNKAVVAAEAIKRMNPSVKMRVFELKLGPDSESVFDEDFWSSINIVLNALDNFPARLFVDEKCVIHGKPFIDSGTLGTKGNVQVVLPHLTETYGTSRDQEMNELPLCTVKYYPYAIEHCLQWSRNIFENLFHDQPLILAKILSSKTRNFHQLSPAELSDISEFFIHRSAVINENDCIIWARCLWEHLFKNDLLQLLAHFPPDAKNSQGLDFWTPPKKCPKALEFCAEDQRHMEFIIASAHLKAETLGIKIESRNVDIKAFVKTISLPPFKPKVEVFIPEDDLEMNNDNETRENKGLEKDTLEKIITEYKSSDSEKISPIEFEKDVEGNHHMDFIHTAANLRAINYGIPSCDRSTSKLIAGKIIPALATTTAVVAGLATLEFMKVIMTEQPRLELFKNSFANLALPLLAFSDPLPTKWKNYLGKNWSQWDFIEMDRGHQISLKKILEEMLKCENFNVVMMCVGSYVIYNSFMNDEKREKRLSMTVPDILKELSGKQIQDSKKFIIISLAAEDPDGNDIEVPDLKLSL